MLETVEYHQDLGYLMGFLHFAGHTGVMGELGGGDLQRLLKKQS